MEIKNAFHIPESSYDKIINSIVRIEIKMYAGTGFFIIFNIKQKILRCILTCSHLINMNEIDNKNKFNIYYGKKNQAEKKTIHLDKTKRYIKCFPKPVDVTIIQIIEEDNIPKDKYLYPDIDVRKGVKCYEKAKTCLAGYPNSAIFLNERYICSGEIIKIINEYEFEHSMDTRSGSSGSPICLVYNQGVIAIHKKVRKSNNIKYGTFIGYIIDLLEKENISDIFLESAEKNQKTDDGEEKEITPYETIQAQKENDLLSTLIASMTKKSGDQEELQKELNRNKNDPSNQYRLPTTIRETPSDSNLKDTLKPNKISSRESNNDNDNIIDETINEITKDNIEEIKKNKLKENIKTLENLSTNLQKSINELKKIFDKITECKKNLKKKIQIIFTKISNALNNREDELLIEVDNKFDELFFNQDLVKEGEKLPNKIKQSLEKGKLICDQWNNNKLNSLKNDYLDIENNIKTINIINENIKKFNSNSQKIKFNPDENKINEFLESIKKFGNIYSNSKYNFKKCPLNIKENRKFSISGDKDNIFTKTGNDNDIYTGTISEYRLDQSIEEHKWKIKILKTKYYYILIGVATIDFDFNIASYEANKNFGWYYFCCNGTLYSGPPHNYQNKNINLKSKKNEIIVIMNMKKRTLKFIIDNKDYGDSYTNIPLDKPICPSVLLCQKMIQLK